jgi:hypothetical protein
VRLRDVEDLADDVAESMAGLVLGIMTTPVMPPLIAASVPVAMVSLASNPGSRKWTWASNMPGIRMRPAASMTRAGLSHFAIEHGHAHGDAVFDLVVDEGAFVVHHGVAEFDAAVHRAGVHEVEAAVADFGEAGLGDAVEFVVFAQAGEVLDVLAFHLDAQQIDDIRLASSWLRGSR